MGYIHVPLNRLHPQCPGRQNYVVVVLPVGGTEEGGAHPRDRLDLVVARVDVLLHLGLGEFGEVGVVVGVVHHLLSRLVEGQHRLGVFVHPLSHHEKGGRHAVFSQNVDELLGVLVTPG